MSKMDDAKSLADSYLEEIEATIEIRQSYTNIVVAMAGPLMGALKHDKAAQTAVQQALKYKTVDPSTLYKPMIVQIHGVFENYIRSLVKAVIEERFEVVELYSSLEQGFRNNHVAHAARVLAHVKSGNILGVAYNFDNLLTNLGRGLSGQKGYRLNPEVYTKLMGNCTAERLEKLFEAISLPEPLSDALGQNAQIKAHFDDKTKGRVAIRAKEKLDAQINLRNDIVHGDLTRVVDLTALRDTLGFIRALSAGLDQLVRM
ncbi:HEPN domain-containing protein [Mesorhizobium sp. M1403]|uniref:HEPN domain-containing protein n=1 Tax=Mesorhizobium sp. M1403 TaxID=2957097 RepID=UPI00333BC5F5